MARDYGQFMCLHVEAWGRTKQKTNKKLTTHTHTHIIYAEYNGIAKMSTTTKVKA